MTSPSGKIVVVTGAGGGIGRALALAFAKAGAKVVVADVEAPALAETVGMIEATGAEVLGARCDVSVEAEVQQLAAATMERFGAVHVVCNNAGVAGLGDPWFGPIESWTWVMGVNFWGVVHGVRAFLPLVLASGGGHIVNTASVAGLYPGLAAPYDASKHAVVALTENLFHMVRNAGLPVGVSCLCPGWVRTGILESERNWPDAFGEKPVVDAGTEVILRHTQRAIAEGMPPAVVADLVLDAVATGRYWVFPHPDWISGVVLERFHRVAEGVDPQTVEQMPGMPPTSQLMAEVMAALTTPAS